MDDEDYLSMSLIPDTPSPVFNRRGKSRIIDMSSSNEESAVNASNYSTGEASSLNSIESKQNSPDSTDNRNNLRCSVGVPNGLSLLGSPQFTVQNGLSLPDSPQFTVPNGLSLPGSPQFAVERQEMVRKKLSHKQKSPFSKSKYTSLSPIKNRYTSCKFDNQSPPSSSVQFPLSTLDRNEVSSSSCMQQQPKFSGFVKSSSLLQGRSAAAAALKQSSKRKKIETVTFNDAVVNRVKKKPHKATIGWPSSSSDSSDDDDLPLPCRGRKVIKTKSSTNNSACGSGRPIQYTDYDGDKFSVGCSSQSDWGKNTLAVSSLANKKSKKRKVETTSLYDTDQDFGSGAYLNYDSNNSTLFNHAQSAETGSAGCKKDKKAKKLKSCDKTGVKKTKSPNKPLPSQQTDTDLSHGFTSPVLSTGIYGRQPHLFHHRDLMSDLQLSPFDINMVSSSSSSGSTPQPHADSVMSTMLMSDSRTSSLGVANSSGTSDNPIDLTSMTPDTHRAVKEIKQLQSDEDMARKLQEELDREYAMSLQSDNHHPHGSNIPGIPHTLQTGAGNIHPGQTGASNIHRGPSVHSEIPTPSPLWHSPVRHHPSRRRGGGGASRHVGDAADSSYSDQLLRILQDTEHLLHLDLGPNAGPDVHLSHLWDRVPSRRGRRRGGRRGRGDMFGMYSPAGDGEDYEHLMNLAEMLGEVKDKGLSKTELARLPIVSYTKTEGQEVEECNICMTDYEQGDSQKILPCFHSFHCTCIDKWIAKNATCPICRVEVKTGRYSLD